MKKIQLEKKSKPFQEEFFLSSIFFKFSQENMFSDWWQQLTHTSEDIGMPEDIGRERRKKMK